MGPRCLALVYAAKMKPLIVLIPGLDGTGLLYYRQIEPLEERYRVLAYRPQSRAVFDYQDLVDELDSAVPDVAPASMTVVGESFGGTAAMHYVLAYPEKVARLVLINTFSRYRQRIRIRLGCCLAPLLQRRVIRGIKDLVVDRTLEREGIPPEDRKRYHEIIKQVYQPAYRRRLELVRDVDLRGRLKDIRVPTLLFASGCDKIVRSLEEARFMLLHIPHSRLIEFARAGHALLLTPGFVLADYLKERPE